MDKKRVMADSLRVQGDGVEIRSKTVKEHSDGFRELIGFDAVEKWPGAMEKARFVYMTEPSA